MQRLPPFAAFWNHEHYSPCAPKGPALQMSLLPQWRRVLMSNERFQSPPSIRYGNGFVFTLREIIDNLIDFGGEYEQESPRKVLFVHLMGFLESMMDFGITFEDAIKEFLDNSVDSGATTFELFQNLNDSDLRILVADDGCGIPLHFEGEDGENVMEFLGSWPWKPWCNVCCCGRKS